MSSLLQKLYWIAPYPVKNWMASANARKLDRQRYGPEFEQIIDKIAEHDKWSTERLLEYQCQQLRSLIRHAVTKVPYYRRLFTERGIEPDSIAEPEDLQRLPILEKETVRTDSKSLLDETLEPKKLLCGHTSGTTGTPIEFYRDTWLNSAAFAYADKRCREVAGLARRKNRSVSIGVYLVTDLSRTKPPFWVYNRRWDQLYMSCYHLAPKYLDAYVQKIRRFKADYIEGYPSSVYAIAKHIVDNELEPVPFKACFTTAETLFDYHREAIQQAFGCRTYNQYGSGEGVVFAAECEQGSLHLSPEFGIVEIVDDNDKLLPAGRTGQLICTGLINRTQPFIRYRIGDLGALKDGKCVCGSNLPMLSHIEGRIDHVLLTRDGKQVGRLDPVFKDTPGIAAAQIVQDDWGKFRIRIIPGRNYTDEDGEKAKMNLARRLGEGEIKIEIVEEIERTASGKFCALVCNLDRKQTCPNTIEHS